MYVCKICTYVLYMYVSIYVYLRAMYMYVYVYVYYICMCMCVCVCLPFLFIWMYVSKLCMRPGMPPYWRHTRWRLRSGYGASCRRTRPFCKPTLRFPTRPPSSSRRLSEVSFIYVYVYVYVCACMYVCVCIYVYK